MDLRIIDALESNFEYYRCTERYWCQKIIVTQVVLCYVDVCHNPVIETGNCKTAENHQLNKTIQYDEFFT
jgi:hypothetical protein